MTILSWDKPKQVLTKEEWSNISADNAPPGVYVSNMSNEDWYKWRAKLIKGNNPRVEIRKGYKSGESQVIVVSLEKGLRMSVNGTIQASWQEWRELEQAIAEARAVLEAL